MKSLLVSRFTLFMELLPGWVVLAATPWGVVEAWGPHFTVCKDEAMCVCVCEGEHLGFAILRYRAVIQSVAVTSSSPKKTCQGRAALNQVQSRVIAAHFSAGLSPFRKFSDKSLSKCLTCPQLLAKKICVWPRMKEKIILPVSTWSIFCRFLQWGWGKKWKPA